MLDELAFPFVQYLYLSSRGLVSVCSFWLQSLSVLPRLQILLVKTYIEDEGQFVRGFIKILRGNLSQHSQLEFPVLLRACQPRVGARETECSLMFNLNVSLKQHFKSEATPQFSIIPKSEPGVLASLPLIRSSSAGIHREPRTGWTSQSCAGVSEGRRWVMGCGEEGCPFQSRDSTSGQM